MLNPVVSRQKFFGCFSWATTGAGTVVISSSVFKEASILTAEAVPSCTSLLETAEARPRQSPLDWPMATIRPVPTGARPK